MYAYMYAGEATYSGEDAAISIDELIAALEEAKDEGCTHLVGLSGNYRGPRYVQLTTELSFGEEEEEL